MNRAQLRSRACGLLLLPLVGAMGLDATSCLAHDFKLSLAKIPDAAKVRVQALVQPKPLAGSDTVSLDWIAYESATAHLSVFDADSTSTTPDPLTPDTDVGGSGPAFFTDTKYVTPTTPTTDVYFDVFAQGLDTDRMKSIGPLTAAAPAPPSGRPKVRLKVKKFKKVTGMAKREAKVELKLSGTSTGQNAGVAYTGFYYDSSGKRVSLYNKPQIVKVLMPITGETVTPPPDFTVDLTSVAAGDYPVYVVLHSWIQGVDEDDDDGQHHFRIPIFEP